MELTSANIENIVYAIIGISTVVGVAYRTWKKAWQGEKSAKEESSELLTNDQHLLKLNTTIREEIKEVNLKLEDEVLPNIKSVFKVLNRMVEENFHLKSQNKELRREVDRMSGVQQEMFKIMIKLEDRTDK